MHTVTTHQDRTSHSPLALWTAVVVGLAVAMGTVGRRRGLRERAHEDERCAALVTYLQEHLAGADAAIRVVERVRRMQTDERPLFDWLYNEFETDHQVVQALLTMLGTSSGSPKRLLGQASGSVFRHLAGGSAGALPLLRTLSAFPKLNVRTYVQVGGRPGVHFLSLDAGSRLAVRAARALLNLPVLVGPDERVKARRRG